MKEEKLVKKDGRQKYWNKWTRLNEQKCMEFWLSLDPRDRERIPKPEVPDEEE